jgi:hypothetical protein
MTGVSRALRDRTYQDITDEITLVQFRPARRG